VEIAESIQDRVMFRTLKAWWTFVKWAEAFAAGDPDAR
jgi:hypothetical protein